MNISNKELVDDLEQRTKENITIAENLKTKSVEDLNKKKTADAWSALECLEHLNRYGDFYIPEIKSRFITAAQVPETTMFKSGFIGNYFAKSLEYKEKLNKMKTLSAMNPKESKLDIDVIDTFIQQQKEMLELLDYSRTIDLRKNKTSISISKVLKLRMGDTYRVVIYHNQRHLVQANNAVMS